MEEYCSDSTCSTCGEVQMLRGLRRMSGVRAADCCTNATPQVYITALNNSFGRRMHDAACTMLANACLYS